jgi:hypothetical protein
MRRWRAKKLADGLCAYCGEKPHRPGRTSCPECSESGKRRQAAYDARAKAALFEIYGPPVCVCCGEANDAFLTLDHINNDGAAHRREINANRGGLNKGVSHRNFYTALKRQGFPRILQVLCFNCNFAKSRIGYCPHKPTL